MAGFCLPIVTDLNVIFSPTVSPPTCEPDTRIWHRLEKDLYLHTSSQGSAWLYIALVNQSELNTEELVVKDIIVGDRPPLSPSSGHSWEERTCGIWIRRSQFSGKIDEIVTEVDVLFGVDAVDPRPKWTLMENSLRLGGPTNVPGARLSVHHGRDEPIDRITLRAEVGGFKIVQISDTHMVTGAGICQDAVDAHGKNLPAMEADPLTVAFIESILDHEEPNFVVLTGDQLHHDIPDSQTALFKVVAPIIKRSIPFAAVFGNHDSEGNHALSRTAQMSILQKLPFSLCEPGPERVGEERVDGIGNFSLQVLAPAPSQRPLATLYFLDSHGQIPSTTHNPDYAPIQKGQIKWFRNTSQAQRSAREKHDGDNCFHVSLVFLHIPLPEFGDKDLIIHSGHRREPTESSRVNSHFYNALAEEGISALCCGHDHVNNFCALLPQKILQSGDNTLQPGPWLCYGGGSGFGGYCSYGKKRFHRRMRTFELTSTGSLTTWMRVEYATDRVDELVLVERGAVVDRGEEDKTKAV